MPLSSVNVDSVEADEPVVERTAKPRVQDPLAGLGHAVQGQVGSLGGLVERDRRAAAFAVGPLEPRLVDLEPVRIEHDLLDWLDDVHRHRFLSRERGPGDVGLEGEHVPSRYDGAREPVGVRFGHGRRGYWRQLFLRGADEEEGCSSNGSVQPAGR